MSDVIKVGRARAGEADGLSERRMKCRYGLGWEGLWAERAINPLRGVGLGLSSLPNAALLWELQTVTAFVMAMVLHVLVCLDIYFTCRHFHLPSESMAAVVAGLILFQVCDSTLANSVTIFPIGFCLHMGCRGHFSSPLGKD